MTYEMPDRDSPEYQGALFDGWKQGWLTDRFFFQRLVGEEVWADLRHELIKRILERAQTGWVSEGWPVAHVPPGDDWLPATTDTVTGMVEEVLGPDAPQMMDRETYERMNGSELRRQQDATEGEYE